MDLETNEPRRERKRKETRRPTTEPASTPAEKRVQEPQPFLEGSHKLSPANQVCWYMGAAFIVIGLTGYIVPNLLAAHLSPAHNIIHIVSGLAAWGFGFFTNDRTAKKFCYGFGTFYGLLGVAGFIFGRNIDGMRFIWRFIPGTLELGLADHLIHIVIGAIFIAGGYITLRGTTTKGERPWV